MKWWQSGDDELAEYDRRVEFWTSRKQNIPQYLLDDLELLLNSSSVKNNPYNGTKGVDFYWTGTEAGIMEIPLFLRLIYAVDGS